MSPCRSESAPGSFLTYQSISSSLNGVGESMLPVSHSLVPEILNGGETEGGREGGGREGEGPMLATHGSGKNVYNECDWTE